MKNSNHTPGPWHVVEQQGGSIQIQKHLATLAIVPPTSNDFRADARLISAAPELLTWSKDLVSRVEALESVMVTLGFEGAKSVEHLKDAIARATGGAE